MSKEPRGLRGKRILVVDDDTRVRGVVVRAISKLPVEVFEAVHTDDALHLLARQPFDLIVTDWKMPGGGGRRLIEALMEQSPRAQIILLTGALFEASDIDWPGWQIVSGMFEKPVNLDILVAEVERVLA